MNDAIAAETDEKDSIPDELAPELACGLDRPHPSHSWRVPGGADALGPEYDASPFATCPGVEHQAGDELGTYTAMFNEYRREQRAWLGPAQTPLVFHLAKLCAKLDASPDAPAALSSAYLQAFQRLDRQRPGHTQPAGAAGDLPGQGSIFDELD